MGKVEMKSEIIEECTSSDIELETDKLDDVSLDKEGRAIADDGHKETQDSLKPPHSYIALIAKAILSSPSRKMVLSDIYKYVMEKYPFYRSQDKSWRNSVRHNLSLNECFIKVGRSENGKGNFWAVHPANLDDFSKGDYRRRRARRRTRKMQCSPGYTALHTGEGMPPLKSIDEHVRAFYYRPYPIVPPKLRLFPQKSCLVAPRPSAPKKSFRIDSILGKDTEEKPIIDLQEKSNFKCSCCQTRVPGTPARIPASPQIAQCRSSSIIFTPKSPMPFERLHVEPSSFLRQCNRCPFVPGLVYAMNCSCSH